MALNPGRIDTLVLNAGFYVGRQSADSAQRDSQ